MLDIGWSELLVVGVVALIVIGPKDLPGMFRQMGRFTAKMRSMAREFQRAMDQAANESGINDVARDLKSAGALKSTGLNAVRDAATKFEKWDPMKNAVRPTQPPAVAAAAAVTTPGPETQALLDAQVKRQAIIAESTERLRAVSAPPSPAAPTPVALPLALVETPAEPAKPARKLRAKVATQTETLATAPAEKLKKARKTAKAGEA